VLRRERMLRAVDAADLSVRYGNIFAFNGLVIESSGPDAHVGELCEIHPRGTNVPVLAEVVGYNHGRVLMMPYGDMRGVSLDSVVRATGRSLSIPVGEAMLGRVINAFGAPLDGEAPWQAEAHYELSREPINPLARAPIDQLLETGIRCIDSLLTLGVGQRVGVFAGSGVGKSTLLGMLARHVRADVIVVALIGERGREVSDFITHSLGAEGLKRSVVIAATADDPALVRTHAVHSAHAVAEFFRDRGRNVLMILDSMTRFAMAQREIGLAVGEPPTYRGYTPSVFSLMPKLLERCGRLRSGGAITAVYSVLVEGDDMNEPIADHMRAILDGHVVLNRAIAARSHHPAIDVLHSASRLMSAVSEPADRELAADIVSLLATFDASKDLIEMGAYQEGNNPMLDRAVRVLPAVQRILRQLPEDSTSRSETLEQLRSAVGQGLH